MLGQSSSDAGSAIAIVLIVYLAVIILFFVGWWRILSKAGYSGAWVFIGLVPLANIVMFFVFAFSEWPVLQERDRYRALAMTSGPGYGYGGQIHERPIVPPPPPPPP